VTNYRWLPALGMTAVALALTGCGSGNSSSDANVRIANATLTHPSIDLLVNGASSITGDLTDTVSGYVTPGSGSVALQINDTSGASALSTSVPTLTGGAHYTLVVYESSGLVKTAILTEDTVVPAAGVTSLRIYDAAIEAGKLDVYITPVPAAGTPACSESILASISPTTQFGLLTAPGAVALTQGAGSFDVCVTGSGSKTDLRMTLPITLTGASVATVMLTPASGGALLNGSLVVQQGAYTAARNTNTRVRLAASVAGNATVAASSSSGITIDGGTVSPVLDFTYATVPSADTLNITSNGASIAAPAGTLPLGGDVTLLVYGNNGATPTASLIVDDNRVPTDQTTAKLRVINGLTGTSALGTLTLTANNTPVGVNVVPGTAGAAYAAIPGSSVSTSFSVLFAANSSAVGGPLPLSTASATQTLNAGTTYEVLVGGDINTPVVLAR
jgi:Domain of unknown function (DUF4397)